MDSHKFRIGQTIRFTKAPLSSGLGGTPPGHFKILGLLPNYQGNNQYRVQSTNDSHQRVAVESEIALP